MKKISETMLSSGVCGTIAFAIWVLYAFLGMPTTANMNKFAIASFLGTAVVLFVARITPIGVVLGRIALGYWTLVVGVGAIALTMILVCSLWKLQLPMFSQQAYAVVMVAALTGVYIITLLRSSIQEMMDSRNQQRRPAGRASDFQGEPA